MADKHQTSCNGGASQRFLIEEPSFPHFQENLTETEETEATDADLDTGDVSETN